MHNPLVLEGLGQQAGKHEDALSGCTNLYKVHKLCYTGGLAQQQQEKDYMKTVSTTTIL